MKQREGLFRRSTKATTILQWIEECMATESWWIHVQSSADMFPVAAPTPPATPSAQRIDEEMEISSSSSTFNPMASFFSPRSSPALADIVSPRPEDRVLDCAILVSRLRRSGEKVVVLSHSVSLKIKAMAEVRYRHVCCSLLGALEIGTESAALCWTWTRKQGLPCEGAKEFRESLMDPSSRRFMWAASAPRGAAWSCLDASALAENYYNSHHHAMKRSGVVPAAAAAARPAKGLKLILRHNSLYAQATTETPPLLASALASV